MNRYVISYKMIMTNDEVIFIDFDDPRAIYVNDDTFDLAFFAAISWLADHSIVDGYYDFEICGIKRVYT